MRGPTFLELAVIVLLATVPTFFATNMRADDEATTKPAATNKPVSTASAALPDLAKIDQAYAEQALKLAETELHILTTTNERLNNAYPKIEIDRARAVVAVAKWRLDHVTNRKKVSEYDNYLAAAEADAKIAKLAFEAAANANKRIANAVPALNLETLKLRADLAQLRVERIRAAKDQPETVMLRWQVQDLRDQIARLTTEVETYRGNQ